MKIRRIMVPTDFSAHSLEALEYATDFVNSQDAELLLVNVVEPIRHTRFIPDVSELLEARRAEAAERLAELEKDLKKRHANSRSEIHFGVPYEVIADVAKKSKTDLIIIATHGHTGLYHMLLGSVAERVVRIAPCPVLTVRVTEATKPTPRRRTARRTVSKRAAQSRR